MLSGKLSMGILFVTLDRGEALTLWIGNRKEMRSRLKAHMYGKIFVRKLTSFRLEWKECNTANLFPINIVNWFV